MRRWLRLSSPRGSGACCVGSLAACGSSAADDAATATATGPGRPTPYEVAATPLTDTDDQPYSLVDDTDKDLTLVFFGYTHCPDICQVVMSNIASAMTRLDDADRERVDVVFVTTDPARDTPDGAAPLPRRASTRSSSA